MYKAIKKRWRYLLPSLVLIGCVGVALSMLFFRPKPQVAPLQPSLPVVEAITVSPQCYQLRVSTQGTVAPGTESLLVSEVSGRILAVSSHFKSGGFFEKDEVLVQIDPVDYHAAEAEAAAELATSERVFAEEVARAQQALEDWEALGQGSAGDLVLRKPQLTEARSEVQAAAAELKRAQRNVERTQVKAPYDGRIQEKSVDVGQHVERATVLARIYAIDYAEIRLPLSNQEVALIDLPLPYQSPAVERSKPKVILTATFAGQRYQWEGFIDRVEGRIDVRSRLLYLVARVADPYRRKVVQDLPPLEMGLFVEAEIYGKWIEAAFVVPRAALFHTDRVLVIGDDRKLRSRNVRVVQTDDQVAVIDSGLKPGERICISPIPFFVEEMPVVVQQLETNQKSAL